MLVRFGEPLYCYWDRIIAVVKLQCQGCCDVFIYSSNPNILGYFTGPWLA